MPFKTPHSSGLCTVSTFAKSIADVATEDDSPAPQCPLPLQLDTDSELTELTYAPNDHRWGTWETVLKDSAELANKRCINGLVCPSCKKTKKLGNGDGFSLWSHLESSVPDDQHGDLKWFTAMKRAAVHFEHNDNRWQDFESVVKMAADAAEKSGLAGKLMCPCCDVCTAPGNDRDGYPLWCHLQSKAGDGVHGDADFLLFLHSLFKNEKPCSVCLKHLSEDKFGKKQFKKLSPVCLDCAEKKRAHEYELWKKQA